MKINLFKLTIASTCICLVALTGCLKDSNYDNGTTQSVRSSTAQNAVEISLTVTSNINFQFLSVNTSPNDTTVNLIPVTLASASAAAQDIHVTLKLDANVLANYNAANGTNYVLPPTNIYTIINVGNVVTIPAGSNTGYLQVKFTPNNYLAGGLAFAFSIASVDGSYNVSSNLSTGIVAIGIKNKYDGNYSLRIKTVGWGAYGISDNLTGDWPAGSDGRSIIGLVTSGATTNTFADAYRGDNLQPAFTTGNAGATAFGATTPQFTFDLTTNNLVSVTNTTPDDGRGRFLLLNPSVTNSRYDPATKTIYAAYIMKQNGRVDQMIYDTLKYIGPR